MSVVFRKFFTWMRSGYALTRRFTFDAGEITRPAYLDRTTSVTLQPPSGGSARVEYSTSPRALIKAGVGIWIAWPPGDVTRGRSRLTEVGIIAVRGVGLTGSGAIMELTA